MGFLNFSQSSLSAGTNGVGLVSDCYHLSMHGSNKDDKEPRRPFIETAPHGVEQTGVGNDVVYNLGIPLTIGEMQLKAIITQVNREIAQDRTGFNQLSFSKAGFGKGGIVNTQSTTAQIGFLRADLNRVV